MNGSVVSHTFYYFCFGWFFLHHYATTGATVFVLSLPAL